MKLLSKLDSTSMINTDSANQFISAAEKTKLAGIAAGAEVNVNANWSSASGDSQILNKPTTIAGYGITNAYTKTEVDNAINSAGVGLATSTTDGMESSAQFNKLAGIFMSSTAGSGNAVSGTGSMTIGSNNTVSGDASLAQGYSCEATGTYSHAEGYGTKASALYAHAEGSGSRVTDFYSHAEGCGSLASGMYSHAEGYYCTAGSSSGAHAGGYYSTASGEESFAHGNYLNALADQFVIGHYNNAGTAGSSSGTTGDAFIIGNGVSGTLGRGFRVSYAGLTYADGAYSSGGADYAEIYEWKDGNPTGEDRVGHFVTLDGENIVFADPSSDYILGIVSANPSVCGDNPIDWRGKYVTDAFGRRNIISVDMPAVTEDITKIDENGNTVIQTVTVQEAYTAKTWEVNPDYDETQVYVPRDERKEYDYIGTHGKLVIIDDGTCAVNGYCWVAANGIATADTVHREYRVIARIDSAHIRVVLK